MADNIEVDTSGFRSAATDFEACTHKVESILKNLRTSADGRGACWGDDKTGEQFANGEKGYLAGRDNLYASLQNNIDRFTEQTRELRKAAKAFEVAEDNSTRSLKPR
ncbi:hypothetical protein [Nocardia brasiliensis]|uniref:hypothetical protein n=1 Tax=Nocardia brasiliensis TaxID=37326 RepID=UPI00367177FE